jgi:hypothetical protein
MPSLLPASASQQAAPPMVAEQQSAWSLPPVVGNKQTVNWALWLSLGAFVMAAAAAIWSFTRSDADALSSAPTPATPLTAPAPSTTAVSPTPGPAVLEAPTPVPTREAEPVTAPSPAPVPITAKAPDPLAAEKKVAVSPQPAPVTNNAAENSETNPVSAAPRTAPQIRLGKPTTSRDEADSPLVLTKPSATAAATPAKVDRAPPPVNATPNVGLRSIARCADIRQRAGLEDLTAEERQFLRTQCR